MINLKKNNLSRKFKVLSFLFPLLIFSVCFSGFFAVSQQLKSAYNNILEKATVTLNPTQLSATYNTILEEAAISLNPQQISSSYNPIFEKGREDEVSMQYQKRYDMRMVEEVKSIRAKRGNKVVIGIVTCGNGRDRQLYLDETVNMIKSVLISAEIYNVPLVEFHHFLEHPEDEKLFRQKLDEMGYPNDRKNSTSERLERGKVNVRLNFYSILNVRIPRQFVKQMIFHPRFRCAYVRFYFPSALPKVDSLIYMDGDAIITGNVMQVFDQFSKMNSRQMIGAVNDMEPENDRFPDKTEWVVGGIPHLTRNGFNSGILWMNLTRMREFGWEERFTRVYQDYSRNIADTLDQQILNILVYFNPELLFVVPCQFNFGPASCEGGFFCRAAIEDPLGIQLIHGNGFSFKQGRPLHGVYKHFEQFYYTRNSYSVDYIKDNLLKPIRSWYRYSNSNSVETVGSGKCMGTLSRMLFPNFF